MRIKICGIRNSTDIKAALEAGADALGFLVGAANVAEDKVEFYQARRMIMTLPPSVSSVMVTHLTDRNEIIEMAKYLRADMVQIHSYISPEDVEFIKTRLPHCEIIKTIHVSDEQQTLEIVRSFEGVCDALLLDSGTEDRLGGTSIAHDWDISAKVVETSKIPVILAGGLTDENVYDAILRVKPHGVDVNSGVERFHIKSFERCARFVSETKRAFGEIQ